MWLPDRRTTIVLASLVTAMTMASGLLLLLEPSPRAPGALVSLSSVQPVSTAGRPDPYTAETPDTEPGRWSAIVIHDTRSRSGSAENMDEIHRSWGLDGLAYHFVISNGKGGPDGGLTASRRWHNQIDGAYASGQNADWLNRHAIGICLVGDRAHEAPTDKQMQQLVALVQQLQHDHGIPAERVMDERGSGDRAAGLFPKAQFRRQLLTHQNP